jgi:prepilin-type processing-associated H-X9-DG protein
VLTQDVTWAAASASAPPNAQAKLVVQAKDAPSATAVSEMLTGALNMWKVMQQSQGVKDVDAATAAMTPKLQGDQLVLTLDNAAFAMVAKQLTFPFMQSRQQALRVRSASNMRQLLQTCLMYSNEHKGAWPDDFKALQEAAKKFAGGPNAAAVFTNPARPEMNPAYVYVKPDVAQGPNAGEQLVIYEAHKDFGDGVNIGFADGHVEFVMNENRFNDLLAKAAAQPGK